MLRRPTSGARLATSYDYCRREARTRFAHSLGDLETRVPVIRTPRRYRALWVAGAAPAGRQTSDRRRKVYTLPAQAGTRALGLPGPIHGEADICFSPSDPPHLTRKHAMTNQEFDGLWQGYEQWVLQKAPKE